MKHQTLFAAVAGRAGSKGIDYDEGCWGLLTPREVRFIPKDAQDPQPHIPLFSVIGGKSNAHPFVVAPDRIRDEKNPAELVAQGIVPLGALYWLVKNKSLCFNVVRQDDQYLATLVAPTPDNLGLPTSVNYGAWERFKRAVTNNVAWPEQSVAVASAPAP